MIKNIKKTVVLGLTLLSFVPTILAHPILPFPVGRDVSERFTGTVHFNALINYDESHKVAQTNVITFEPGSRSAWHVHGGMTIIGIGGEGIYQEFGKEPIAIHKGTIVHIPEGTLHWHGATKDASFQQIVIYDSTWQPREGAPHKGTIGDEEYGQLKLVEADHREHESDGEQLFKKPSHILDSPNFTKPVGLSILFTENEGKSPHWAYVDFPAGTYNKWHSHTTGQFLIATDGIGYHQKQGEAVDILYPGDVVYCPPGEVHWHGATGAHNFAHITINPDNNHDVIWYDFLSQEEYDALPKPE